MPPLQIVRMPIITLAMALGTIANGPPSALAHAKHPDFSGRWVIDQPATIEAAQAGHVNGTIIFGESFVATQTAASIKLDISAGGLAVSATYALDGSESRNTSPPTTADGQPIVVTATAKWVEDKLVILSTSQSPGTGRGAVNGMVTVRSTRTMWLDAAGRLVIERIGTPASMMPASTSVYVKDAKAQPF